MHTSSIVTLVIFVRAGEPGELYVSGESGESGLKKANHLPRSMKIPGIG